MGVKIKFQKINEKAITPHYIHEGDSGMDLFSCVNDVLSPGERKLIPTGLKAEIPRGYEMQIRPKSGLALKSGITVLNTPGTVDSGYRGEIAVILYNASNQNYEVAIGQKIAQAVISRIEEAEIEEVNELSNIIRGEGGFGSTGLEVKL